MTRSTTARASAVLFLAAASVVALAGCSAPSEPSSDPSDSAEAVVSTPAINEEGVLSVCTALGLGAIPLFYFDADQEPRGIEIEMAQAVADVMGLEYRPVSTAFPSLIPSLDAKQCDLVMGSLFITEERSEVVDFVPYLESGSVMIVSADNAADVAEFGPELCGLRVGSTAGSSASVALKELSEECTADGDPAIVLTEVDSAATGRQMVLNGQVDTMAGSSADMYYIAAESNGDIEVAGEPFQTFEIGAAVRKGNDELRDAVAAAFEEIVADGSYADILDSVGLESISYFD